MESWHLISRLHIHNPLVQASIVDPTPNPSDLPSKTLLTRYDFPVRYAPQTTTTDTVPSTDAMISIASSLMAYSIYKTHEYFRPARK
jgi:hypothetical protein